MANGLPGAHPIYNIFRTLDENSLESLCEDTNVELSINPNKLSRDKKEKVRSILSNKRSKETNRKSDPVFDLEAESNLVLKIANTHSAINNQLLPDVSDRSFRQNS